MNKRIRIIFYTFCCVLLFSVLAFSSTKTSCYAHNAVGELVHINDLKCDSFFCSKSQIVISEAYDLGGRIIEFNQSNTLDLSSGYLENGTLVGNNTILIAPPRHIFGDNLILKGTWIIKECYPQWFGAKGDGSINDNHAFQRLLDMVQNTNINNIYIPQGVYNIEQLKIKKNSTTIRGDQSTYWCTGTILCGTTTKNLIEIDAQAVIIKDLYIYSTQDRTRLRNAKAISADFSKNRSGLRFENISINGYGTGIYTNHCFLSKIVFCRAANCKTGFSINNIGTSVELDKCWSLSCEAGYMFSNCTYCKLNNCCSDNCRNGYIINGTKGAELSSCACETSKGIPIIFENTTACIINFVSHRCNESFEHNALVGYAYKSVITAAGCVVSEKPKGIKREESPQNWSIEQSNFHEVANMRRLSESESVELPVKSRIIRGKTSQFGILDSGIQINQGNIINAICLSDINTIVLPFSSGSPLRWQFKVLSAVTMTPIKESELEVILYIKN